MDHPGGLLRIRSLSSLRAVGWCLEAQLHTQLCPGLRGRKMDRKQCWDRSAQAVSSGDGSCPQGRGLCRVLSPLPLQGLVETEHWPPGQESPTSPTGVCTDSRPSPQTLVPPVLPEPGAVTSQGFKSPDS